MSDNYSVPLKCRYCGNEWAVMVKKGNKVDYTKGEGVKILKQDNDLEIVDCPTKYKEW